MVFIIPKYRRDKEKKSKGLIHHDEMFPEEGKIIDKTISRRKLGKPLDGSYFKDVNTAIKELKQRRIEKQRRR